MQCPYQQAGQGFCVENLRVPVTYDLCSTMVTNCNGTLSTDSTTQSQLNSTVNQIFRRYGPKCSILRFLTVGLERASNNFLFTPITSSGNTNRIDYTTKLRVTKTFSAIDSINPAEFNLIPITIYFFSLDGISTDGSGLPLYSGPTDSLSQANRIAPYIVTQGLSLSVNTFTIPSTIPSGTYGVLFYADKLLYSFANFNLTLSGQPTPLPTPTPTPVTGATPSCYNGVMDPTTHQCNCFLGFQGDKCENYSFCSPSSLAASKCNSANGMLLPKSADTVYPAPGSTATVQKTQLDCTQCICFNQFDPADNCNSCGLQCGAYGQPNADCTACQCSHSQESDGFAVSGSQCECRNLPFSINYNLPPPFLQQIYSQNKPSTASKSTLLSTLSTTQLSLYQRWESLLLNDLASDLSIPTDKFSITNFGTYNYSFVILFNLKLCVPFQTKDLLSSSDQLLSPKDIKAKVATIHNNTMSELITNFQSQFSQLGDITTATAPKIRIPNPTFNYITLFTSQTLKTIPTNDIGRCGPGLQCPSVSASEATLHDGSFMGPQRDTVDHDTFLSAAVPSSNNTLSKFYYQHPAISTGPGADSTGGFYSTGKVFDVIGCQNQGSDPSSCTPPPLTATAPQPRPTPRSKGKGLSSGAIAGIIVGIIFLILVIIAFLLCFSWIKQIWCFHEYHKKREEEKRARKAQMKSSRLQASNSGPNELNSGPNALKSGPKTQKAAQIITSELSPTSENETPTTTGITSMQGDRTGLPPGWSKIQVDGNDVYVNEQTMTSTRIRPQLEPKLEEPVGHELGW